MRITIPALLLAGLLPFVSGCVGGLASVGPLELGCVGMVVLILNIVALVDIFRSTRPVSEKAIFILLIFVLPVIGLIAYYLLRGQQ